jgi:hypothetical protein
MIKLREMHVYHAESEGNLASYTQLRSDMEKLIALLRFFLNAPKTWTNNLFSRGTETDIKCGRPLEMTARFY